MASFPDLKKVVTKTTEFVGEDGQKYLPIKAADAKKMETSVQCHVDGKLGWYVPVAAAAL